MKKLLFAAVLFLCSTLVSRADQWIRINQLGYLPQSIKVAVFISEENATLKNFEVVDATTQKTVKTIANVKSTG
jgi:hypothetical protein